MLLHKVQGEVVSYSTVLPLQNKFKIGSGKKNLFVPNSSQHHALTSKRGNHTLRCIRPYSLLFLCSKASVNMCWQDTSVESCVHVFAPCRHQQVTRQGFCSCNAQQADGTYQSSGFIRVFVVVLRILRGEINASSLTKLKMENSSIEFLMAVVMCCSSNLWFSSVV